MAALYDSELTAVADRLVPARIVVCRQRPSDLWFDNDAAKRNAFSAAWNVLRLLHQNMTTLPQQLLLILCG
jgi:hypothetical protein